VSVVGAVSVNGMDVDGLMMILMVEKERQWWIGR
jgi:hypothetical protein